VTLSEVTKLCANPEDDDQDLPRRAIAVPALPQGWKDFLSQRLRI
jgi:hypothetical protein